MHACLPPVTAIEKRSSRDPFAQLYIDALIDRAPLS